MPWRLQPPREVCSITRKASASVFSATKQSHYPLITPATREQPQHDRRAVKTFRSRQGGEEEMLACIIIVVRNLSCVLLITRRECERITFRVTLSSSLSLAINHHEKQAKRFNIIAYGSGADSRYLHDNVEAERKTITRSSNVCLYGKCCMQQTQRICDGCSCLFYIRI